MFAKLTGTIDFLPDGDVCVDVAGVGYRVKVSAKTAARLILGTPASLLIDTHVREDAIVLFGFATTEEKGCFQLLTTVQGVGGKAALSILSVLTPAEVHLAIAAQDKKPLTEADGVGNKLAERIINELKDKIGTLVSAPSAGVIASPLSGHSPLLNDAVSALVNLGFPRASAYQVVSQSLAANENQSIQDLITLGLRELSA